jgi:two-component system, OmpR family, sensor histidine kinase MtrB
MLAFGLVSLVLSSTLALITFTLVRTWAVEDREDAAMAQAYSNARLLRTRLRAADTDLTTVISGLQGGSTDVVLLEREGLWYSSSVGVDRASLPTALRDAVSDGEVARQIVNGSDGLQIAIGVPIPEVAARYFELVELDDTENTLRILGTSLAMGAAGAAVIGALTGAALSGRVLRPLRRVSAVAQQVRDGGPSARLEPSGDPDLDPLTDSFNGMLDELEERARREARFASDVSHDLRGPLTALAAAISVVNRRRAQLPPEASQAIDALDEQVTAFNRLVIDLLEISRFEAGTAELDAREVGALEFVRAVLSEAHRDVPVIAPPGYSPRLVIDPRRVRQALGNLLENADLYGGGVTKVCVEPGEGDTVRIVVEDGGPGVDPADREAIFNRYERGRAHRDPDLPKGTGLGLALSMQHIRLHGGTIQVGDAPGGGARFVIELPVGPS